MTGKAENRLRGLIAVTVPILVVHAVAAFFAGKLAAEVRAKFPGVFG